MVKAIEKSAAACMSGLRCWAAFNDALGCVEHFPAKPEMVEQFVAMFESTATLQQYLKHLRWALRFLHVPNAWDTDSLQQMLLGAKKMPGTRRPRIALTSEWS